jgi:tetratricopeptide (TPR) repeat protein
MGGYTDMLDDGYFVGRREAFERFDEFMATPSKQVFLILGPGGIGKTWLARRLIRYAKKEYPDALIADNSIDLLSTQYHRISELWDTIAKLSNKYNEFKTYRQEYDDLQGLRIQDQEYPDAAPALQNKSKQVHRLFAQDCRRAFGNRVALLWFDTFESVRYDPVGSWLLEEFPRDVDNVRLIVAGRPGDPPMPAENSEMVYSYKLSGLDPESTQRFYETRFTYKLAEERLGSTKYVPDSEVWNSLCEKLDYHPLAMDLAIMWVNFDITTYENLTQLSSGEIMRAIFLHLRKIGQVPGIIPPAKLDEFDKQEIEKLKTAAYRIILYIAFLNRRFDEYFLERVYPEAPHYPELEYAKIVLRHMPDVPSMFFVKEREGGLDSGGYLQLHDEVRDRVLEILWPIEDDPVRQGRPEDALGEDREYIAEKALEIYNELIKKAKDDREQEELRVEQLSYTLKIDFQGGYEQFQKDFQRNFDEKNWGICQLLLNEISPYYKKLSLVQRREFEAFRFQLARDQQYFDIAESLIKTPTQQVDYLLERQRIYAHTNLTQAKQCAKEALSICEDHQELKRQKAQAERALGFVSRALGQLQEAIEWYQSCQKTSRFLGGKEGASLYAYAQNNEGYIWALIGEYDRAIEIVESALRIRRKYDQKYEIAQSLSTLGEIARFRGDFHKAGNYYRTATDIFSSLRAHDWGAILWHQRAENARRIAERETQYDFTDEERVQKYLSYALEDIELSLEIFDRYHLSRDLHKAWRRMGLIQRDLGNLEEAEGWLNKAFELAKQSNDPQEASECLIHLSDVQIRQEDYQATTKTLSRIDDFKKTHNFQVFLGLRDIYLTKVILVQGDNEQALQRYSDGLLKLAQETGYGHARLRSQIPQIPKVLERLPTPKEQRRWCRRLLKQCEEKNVEEIFPQLVRAIKRYLDALDFLTGDGIEGSGK